MFNKTLCQLTFTAVAMVSIVALADSSVPTAAPLPGAAAPAPAVNPAPAPDASMPAPQPQYVPGTPTETTTVTSIKVFSADPAAPLDTQEQLQSLFATFPALGQQTGELSKIDHAVLTSQSNLELYSGNDLIVVLAVNAGSAQVIYAMDPQFQAQSVQVMSSQDAQNTMTSEVTFNLQECITPESKEAAQEQGQFQGKEQPAAKESICKTLTTVLNLQGLPQKSEKQAQVEEKRESKQPVVIPEEKAERKH